jgi:molybdenum cofactor biosynthesis enzyme MoaA
MYAAASTAEPLPVLRTTDRVYAPEDHPFQTVIVDLTHRCNMACKNCYIPNRELPDLDADWLMSVLRRCPRRTRVRLAGAEPTMREDLPALIRGVRDAGHIPLLLTNGLKLASRRYVATLRDAGLRIVYLSMNGGLSDPLYEAIDELACARSKLAALDHLCDARFYLSLGTIVVRGVNEAHIPEYVAEVRQRLSVREIHLRTVGAMGRHQSEVAALDLDALIALASQALDVSPEWIRAQKRVGTAIDFVWQGTQYQLTEWPDLGSHSRGRLAPDGSIQPFFEHVIANEGGW